MAKRFTDSRKWDDEWFISLNSHYQLLWMYILDKCNHIGIYKPALSLAGFCIHCDYNEDEVLKVFADRIVVLPCGKWFIPKFLSFQYGELSASGQLHGKIIKDLKDSLPSVLFKSHVRVTAPCRQGGNTLKDKDKDKDKVTIKKEVVKEKTKYGEVGLIPHVELSAEEYQRIVDMYGTTMTKKYIEDLNLYAAQKPKRFKEYASHSATIQAWMRRDGVKKLPPKQELPKEELRHDPKVADLIRSTKDKIGAI